MNTMKIAAGAAVLAGLLAGCGSGGSPNADTSSQSYQLGLATGTDGQAAVEADSGRGHAHSPQEACENEFNTDNGAASDVKLVKKDFMAGCLHGLNDAKAHPSKNGGN